MEKSLSSELLKIVRSLKILSSSAYIFNGDEYQVIPESNRVNDQFTDDRGLSLTDSLTQVLYHKCYCQVTSPVLAAEAISLDYNRSYIHELSQANTGKGTWDDGWEIRHIEDDGRMAVRKNDLTIWVSHKQFSSKERTVEVGNRGYIRVAKEFLWLYRGFYMALGNQPMEDDNNTYIVRIYWHIKAAGAAVLMNKLTGELNENEIPFRFKILNEPSNFGRADAATLYMPQSYYKKSFALLAEIHEKVKVFLDKSVPLFTKRLAHGIGLAEDPPNGESFGLNRCRLVAEALFRCHQKALRDDQEKLTEIFRRFVEVGLNLKVPYLNPGSKNSYTLIDMEDFRHFAKK